MELTTRFEAAHFSIASGAFPPYYPTMNINNLTFHTFDQRPDLMEPAGDLAERGWPEFLLHSPVLDEYFYALNRFFPDYQFALIDPATDKLLAFGNCMPLHWDQPLEQLPEGGVEWALIKSVEDYQAGITPNLVSALQIVIEPDLRGSGLAGPMVQRMINIVHDHSIRHLVAPLRPNLKPVYPLTPIERYIRWTRSDGFAFDPWIRVHQRLGARVLSICERSMYIPGTVAQWEEWTEMAFPESGEYVIPGALVPITIDCEADHGEYVEPNVWCVHDC